MSHGAPDGTPANYEEDKNPPDVIGYCEVCGVDIIEGTSYTSTSNGYVCNDYGCMQETIYELEGELEQAKQSTAPEQGRH